MICVIIINKFEIIITPKCQQLSEDIFRRNKTSSTQEDGKDHNFKPAY